ncbi:MAG TPA: type II secretion system F family protein [Candidatus Dormibacteraeota bacterium]|jgi:tight adherence protein B
MSIPILVLCIVGAVGVFAIFASLMLVTPAKSDRPLGNPESVRFGPMTVATELTTKERLNQPFQYVADQLSQRNVRRGRLTLAEELGRADLKLRTAEFVMIEVAFMLGAALIGLIRFGFAPQFVIAGIGGYFIPMRFVRFRQRRRQRALSGQLPDTISLLSNALKAGYSFPQAIDTVANNASPPISDEFARVVRELNLGGSIEQSLNNLVRRAGNDDLDLIVTAAIIQSQVGGNLARVLDNISDTIRERVRVKGQISAMTAQGRASTWIITLLPIGLAGLLYVLTPDYFGVMTHTRMGAGLLVLAGVMVALGNNFTRRIARVRL